MAKNQGLRDLSESVTIEGAFPGNGENRLGRALRGARSREVMTKRESADMTGMTQRHISEMETGKRQIMNELAKALHITDYRVFL